MKRSILKETRVVHETANLQMNTYRNYSNVYCHWHDEYEFVLVLQGCCEVISGGVPYALNEGELALIGGGQIHSINITPPSKTAAIVIHPHILGTDCLNYFTKTLIFDPLYKNEDSVDTAVINNVRRLLDAVENKAPAYDLRAKSIIADIFALLIENNRFANKDTKTSEPVIESLVDFIHTNYRENISLDMLSTLTNYSKAYIIRLFKQHTGKTPVEYVNSYRISRSFGLLSNTDMSILDVSMEVGFESTAYFIKLFKKLTGTTPLRWRTSTK